MQVNRTGTLPGHCGLRSRRGSAEHHAPQGLVTVPAQSPTRTSSFEDASPDAAAGDVSPDPREESAQRKLAFLAETSRRLAGSLDYEATLRSVAALALPFLGSWCIVDLVDSDGSMRRVAIGRVDKGLAPGPRRPAGCSPGGAHARDRGDSVRR